MDGWDRQPTDKVIEAAGLGKEYSSAGHAFWVFRHLHLTLHQSEMVCVSGPSGCGKTTLLALLAGLEKPTEGTVRLCGQALSGISELRAATLRREAVGFVFQFFYLLPSITVLENVALPLVAAGKGRGALEKAGDLAEQLGLGDRLGHYPRQLSGGEQQRVALARALIGDPSVIMADEPTGNLDASSAELVLSLLRQQAQGNRAVLVASHNPRVVELSDRVIDLADRTAGGED